MGTTGIKLNRSCLCCQVCAGTCGGPPGSGINGFTASACGKCCYSSLSTGSIVYNLVVNGVPFAGTLNLPTFVYTGPMGYPIWTDGGVPMPNASGDYVYYQCDFPAFPLDGAASNTPWNVAIVGPQGQIISNIPSTTIANPVVTTVADDCCYGVNFSGVFQGNPGDVITGTVAIVITNNATCCSYLCEVNKFGVFPWTPSQYYCWSKPSAASGCDGTCT